MYYSVENCGDGSAYPSFFEDEIAAEVHQKVANYYEGWGEDCIGSVGKAATTEEYIEELKGELKWYKDDPAHLEMLNEAIERLQNFVRK